MLLSGGWVSDNLPGSPLGPGLDGPQHSALGCALSWLPLLQPARLVPAVGHHLLSLKTCQLLTWLGGPCLAACLLGNNTH